VTKVSAATNFERPANVITYDTATNRWVHKISGYIFDKISGLVIGKYHPDDVDAVVDARTFAASEIAAIKSTWGFSVHISSTIVDDTQK
jgi:hypothetical protein